MELVAEFNGICNGDELIVWDAGKSRVADGGQNRFWSTVREFRVEGIML